MRQTLRIGACQTPELLGDLPAAVELIESFAADADRADIDLLLFPECFLQGYLVTREHVSRYAVELDSPAFGELLTRLTPIRQTLVFGMIELRAAAFFNTAVIVANGAVVGAYRKTYLTEGESIFTPGDAYPVFELNGVRFGINICYDTRFPEAAAAVAAQGAQVLLVPAQNMMRLTAAETWKDRHNQIRAERVRETGMWLVSSDVTGHRDELRAGYGPTSVIRPGAGVVARVPTMATGMVIAEVSEAGTQTQRRRR